MRRLIAFCAFAASLAAAAVVAGQSAAQDAPASYVPDQIDYSLFHDSTVLDTPECDAHIDHGVVVFGPTVTNPAMSCPNAFAWKRFVETIQDGWWGTWSTDRQTWPSDPWPRCKPGETGNCCPAVEASNETWPLHCPVYPGAAAGVPDRQVSSPSKAHQVDLSGVGDTNGDGTIDWSDVPADLRSVVMAQEQYEIVYRNQPTVNYIFDRSLYYTEGLAQLYDNFVAADRAYAPRQPTPANPAALHATTPPVVNVVFPINSVIIKASWLEADKAPEFGINPYDEDHPFIVMNLIPKDQQEAADGTFEKKPFILLSFSITTKDVPKWLWTMFEHVSNQGRCDWTGCNDAFGYPTVESTDIDTQFSKGLAPPARNFTPPRKLTTLDGRSVEAYSLATRYTGVDGISDALANIFAALDIGTATGINRSGLPTAQDRAWQSYRLKGTQTDFSGFTGRPTRLGGSVSEAGFVNSSSCVTCHARAAVRKGGLPAFSTFIDDLSVQGVPKGDIGVPDENRFQLDHVMGR